MGYRKHTVKQGDCISSIAFRYGFFPNTIWNDSRNSELKELRKDPNVLLPGDVVYVRDKEEREESCASEQKHRFKRKGVPERLIIQFRIDGEPRASEDYVLDIDGALSEGQTDGKGVLETWIPPGSRRGKVIFCSSGEELGLGFGHLDPITELTGVQGRLIDMGFFDGPADGKPSKEFAMGIRSFQEAHDLAPTGELDEATRAAIQDQFGG